MLPHAGEVAADRLFDVGDGFVAALALGVTPRQHRATRNEIAFLVLCKRYPEFQLRPPKQHRFNDSTT